jgi:hypothetical protein
MGFWTRVFRNIGYGSVGGFALGALVWPAVTHEKESLTTRLWLGVAGAAVCIPLMFLVPEGRETRPDPEVTRGTSALREDLPPSRTAEVPLETAGTTPSTTPPRGARPPWAPLPSFDDDTTPPTATSRAPLDTGPRSTGLVGRVTARPPEEAR